MSPSMEFTFLNHASLLIQISGVKILFDPWLWGTGFKEGWALRHDNPDALDVAETADYLWISHFHDDHLHFPSLAALRERNPNIVVLCNKSHNFSMTEPMEAAGFQNIKILDERRPLQLNDKVSVTRFPATAIDNMLLIDDGRHRILNYNDCNLPARSFSKLVAKLPRIDVCLFNFNHAGHLLQYPAQEPSVIKKQLLAGFKRKLEITNPKWAFPFASQHIYIAPEMSGQNESLLDPKELAVIDERVIPWNVGDKVCFSEDLKSYSLESSTSIVPAKVETRQSAETPPANIEEILAGLDVLRKRVNRRMFGVSFLALPVRMYCPDLDLTVNFNFRRSPSFVTGRDRAHIAVRSGALKDLFSARFGADAFFVGGHFEILSDCVSRIQALLVLLNLVEQKVSLGDIVSAFMSRSGRSFLWARREEIAGVILGGSYKVGGRL